MPIESLLKLEEIQKQQNILKIDYSKLDPNIIKETDKTIQEIDETLVYARAEAERLITEAEERAQTIFDRACVDAEQTTKKAQEQAETYKTTAYENIEKELLEKRAEFASEQEKFNEEKIVELGKIQDSKEDIRKEITASIENEVREEATKEAKATYDRLIAQVHSVLNEVIKRRGEMLLETEKEMVSLVLLIARKVVKVFSEKDDTVVIKNIVEALSKLKGREKFIIRINVSQLKYVNEQIAYVKEQLEKESTITVLEDTSVELGGCIVESEFGEVDARISTQMVEIEKRVRATGLVHNVGV